jgi:ATP-dependent exoDNAse (exonuclease V) alpha subunit
MTAELNFIQLSKQQKQVIEMFAAGKNIFVSGGAGSGKSFLLNHLRQKYQQHGLEITASTGIAAVNIQGTTIHSWAGIGLGNLPVSQIIDNLFSMKLIRQRKRILKAKSLAIDEISMISAKTLEILDEVFRKVRGANVPFGGLQVLFFGDFLQLPPISQNFFPSDNPSALSSKDSEIDFCFNSLVWKNLEMQTVILTEQFRQHDADFIEILQDLRYGKLTSKACELLGKRVNAIDSNPLIRPTILTTHNAKVEQINISHLRRIPNPEFEFNATYSGTPNKMEFLKKNCLAYEKLKLKVGAQVMMIKNSFQKEGITNGSIGVVRDFSPKKSFPIVEFLGGKVITIDFEEWRLERFDEEKKKIVLEAEMSQIPLVLAWAITIHKSQGLTLDKISCDLREVFSCGQVYVALSRARSLSSVFIESINFDKINANQSAIEFYKQ